jgi:hypothetical protein
VLLVRTAFDYVSEREREREKNCALMGRFHTETERDRVKDSVLDGSSKLVS